jgi:hypothetical protein
MNHNLRSVGHIPDRCASTARRLISLFRDKEIARATVQGLGIGGMLLALLLWWPSPALIRQDAPRPTAEIIRKADLQGHPSSEDVRRVADWIASTNDASGHAFVVVDKREAQLFVFDANARLSASTPILLGSARGDDSVPGIGNREISAVLPDERTTPAGRFVGERGHNARGEDVVWVDYDAAVSMHRVLTSNPKERRLERLATATSDDNRISYGCINIPVDFYEAHIQPTFAGAPAIIYVLPEVRSVSEVFRMHASAD